MQNIKGDNMEKIEAVNAEVSAKEFDAANTQDQEFFVQKALDVINVAYEKYKFDVEVIKGDNKYSHQYKQDKCQELKEQFMLFKELQLDKASGELEKIKTHLEDIDNIENLKQDKLLNEISKMNLLNMINISLKFEDDTFLKSKIAEIVKHPDLKLFLEHSIKDTNKAHLVVNIQQEYEKQNAKYISLNKLQDKIKVIRSYKDTVFKNLEMSKLEAIR